MDLNDLCQKLFEYGLVDREKFSPNFTERIMREGGGVKVIQNQDSDITANIKILAEGLERCIQAYGPEKVEAFFYLQELANHARMLFYDGAKEFSIEAGNEKKEKKKRGFTEPERKAILEKISGMEPSCYTSKEIGNSLGFDARSVGVFLAHLTDAEREELNLRYDDKERI